MNKVRFVLLVRSDSANLEMEKVCEQNFLPELHHQVLIYEEEKKYLSAWASVVRILFNAYDPIPTVKLGGATGDGSFALRIQKLEKLGWKKV